MKVIAVIPARGGSKRIPMKNAASLGGRPLIAYTIEDAVKSTVVNRVVVSTDNDDIEAISRKCGAEVVRRPPKLSGDTSSSEEALAHVLDTLNRTEGYCPDLVVFLQCTSPLRDGDDIDRAVNRLMDERADSLFSAFRFKKYIWRISEGSAIPINYDHNMRWREQDFPEQFQENGSIYVFRPWVLQDLGNRLGGRIAIHEMSPMNSIQVDTAEDHELCEWFMQRNKQGDLSR